MLAEYTLWRVRGTHPETMAPRIFLGQISDMYKITVEYRVSTDGRRSRFLVTHRSH